MIFGRLLLEFTLNENHSFIYNLYNIGGDDCCQLPMKIEWRSKCQLKPIFSCYSYTIFAFLLLNRKAVIPPLNQTPWNQTSCPAKDCREEFRLNTGRIPERIAGESWVNPKKNTGWISEEILSEARKESWVNQGRHSGWTLEGITDGSREEFLEELWVILGRNSRWILWGFQDESLEASRVRPERNRE